MLFEIDFQEHKINTAIIQSSGLLTLCRSYGKDESFTTKITYF